MENDEELAQGQLFQTQEPEIVSPINYQQYLAFKELDRIYSESEFNRVKPTITEKKRLQLQKARERKEELRRLRQTTEIPPAPKATPEVNKEVEKQATTVETQKGEPIDPPKTNYPATAIKVSAVGISWLLLKTLSDYLLNDEQKKE